MGNKAIRMKNSAGDNLYPCPYFPVGSVYITTVNTNPSQWFGGTWEAFAQGKTLVGVNPNETEFNTVLKTGGEKKHTLTEAEMPHHKLDQVNLAGSYFISAWNDNRGNVGYFDLSDLYKTTGTPYGDGIANSFDTKYKGGNQPHNNLQPYITVYFWRRIA